MRNMTSVIIPCPKPRRGISGSGYPVSKSKFLDVPFHGLGHGIITDIMFLVHQIFADHNKMISFVNLANIIFDDIRTFRLDYCKLKSFPNATQVGEHYMGYMRIMCYLYGSHLLNNQLGPIDETKDTVTNLKYMLNAFQSLVSVLMYMREITTKTSDNHMKLFMSSSRYLHVKYGRPNRKNRQAEGSDEKMDERRGREMKRMIMLAASKLFF